MPRLHATLDFTAPASTRAPPGHLPRKATGLCPGLRQPQAALAPSGAPEAATSPAPRSLPSRILTFSSLSCCLNSSSSSESHSGNWYTLMPNLSISSLICVRARQNQKDTPLSNTDVLGLFCLLWVCYEPTDAKRVGVSSGAGPSAGTSSHREHGCDQVGRYSLRVCAYTHTPYLGTPLLLGLSLLPHHGHPAEKERLTLSFSFRISEGIRQSALAIRGTMLTFSCRAFMNSTSTGLNLQQGQGQHD